MLATCIRTIVEKRRPLRVDTMIPDTLFTSTHAIAIDAPPEQVWRRRIFMRFRIYSLATIAIGLACAAMTGTYASRIQADLPTPGVGVWERISIAAFMTWIAVLATALLRAPHAGPAADHRTVTETRP